MVRMMTRTAIVTVNGVQRSCNIPGGKVQALITGGGFQITDQLTVDILLTLSFSSGEILALGPNLDPMPKPKLPHNPALPEIFDEPFGKRIRVFDCSQPMIGLRGIYYAARSSHHSWVERRRYEFCARK